MTTITEMDGRACRRGHEIDGDAEQWFRWKFEIPPADGDTYALFRTASGDYVIRHDPDAPEAGAGETLIYTR